MNVMLKFYKVSYKISKEIHSSIEHNNEIHSNTAYA